MCWNRYLFRHVSGPCPLLPESTSVALWHCRDFKVTINNNDYAPCDQSSLKAPCPSDVAGLFDIAHCPVLLQLHCAPIRACACTNTTRDTDDDCCCYGGSARVHGSGHFEPLADVFSWGGGFRLGLVRKSERGVHCHMHGHFPAYAISPLPLVPPRNTPGWPVCWPGTT